MVTTTSAAWTISSVHGLGNSAVMSMPDLGHGGDRGGVDLIARFRSARPGHALVTGQVVEVPQRHLRPAGVVGAEEQHAQASSWTSCACLSASVSTD